MLIGMKSYKIDVQLDDPQPTNILTVDFLIWGLATEPKDYQPFIDRLQLLCKDLNEKKNLVKLKKDAFTVT